jgi:hypothetical protein
LRNRGAGKIKIDQIPAGAHVYKAFLYWNIVDETRQSRHKLLFMNGKLVTGSFIAPLIRPVGWQCTDLPILTGRM